jgi:peptide/nickel transport system substrate-binding protein
LIESPRVGKRRRGHGISRAALAASLLIVIGVAALAAYFYLSSQPAPRPAPSRTLIVDKAVELQSLDPAFDYEYAGWEVLQNVYQTLVWYNGSSTNAYVGVLATKWNVSADGLTYTFYLRKGVKFSTGNDFTAEAVRYSFNRVLLMNQPPSWILAQVLDANSVEVVDNYTVRIHLLKPYSNFLALISTVTASIIDPVAVEAHGGVKPNETNPWVDTNTAGTGPFFVSEWVKGDHITLQRNPYYWGQQPFFEKVVLYFKSSAQTRLLDLKSGAAQVAVVDVNHVADIMGQPHIIVQDLGLTYHIDFLFLNTKKFPFNITLVRQAVAHAIDYDSIMQEINRNLTVRFVGPIPRGMEGYDDSLSPYAYNLTLAKELLARAGFPDGKGIPPLTYIYYARDASVALIAQKVQEDLSALGLEVRVVGLPFSTYIDTLLGNPTDPKMPEMGWTEWYPDYAAPDDYVVPFTNPGFPPVGWNPAFWSNETVTQLIAQAPYVLDQAARTAMYHQIIRIMYDQVPYIWLGQFKGYYVYREEVKGVSFNPMLAGMNYASMYLSP